MHKKLYIIMRDHPKALSTWNLPLHQAMDDLQLTELPEPTLPPPRLFPSG